MSYKGSVSDTAVYVKGEELPKEKTTVAAAHLVGGQTKQSY